MRRLSALALLLLVVSISSCQPPVDTAAAAAALRARDKAWAAVAAEGKDVDSVVSFWSANARVILQGAPVLTGTTAIKSMVASSFAAPGFHVSWVTDSVVVAASGDLGYTYGTNTVAMPDSTGRVTTEHGRYVTVWTKEADGQWRCVVDIYNVGPAPASTSS